MWPNFILREFAAVRAMKILGRKNEIVSYSLGETDQYSWPVVKHFELLKTKC